MRATCWVLEFSLQPYYRWLEGPTHSKVEAYRPNALFDHHDDPGFRHQLLAGEARDNGEVM